MGLSDWYGYHVRNGEIQDAIYHLYLGMWRNTGNWIRYGDPIWNDPWDVLIVLDACRYDLMLGVADECEFVQDIGSRYSEGSESGEWMDANFDSQLYSHELSNTAYVTGNGKTETQITASHFEYLDEVWRYAFDSEWGTIRPESVTDRAIDVHRSRDPERMIVHYLQPHLPIVPPVAETRDVPECLLDPGWEDIRKSPDVTSSLLWELSLENLRFVLDSVERVLRNIDAETVVITADHANLFGELRGAGLWGHPPNVPVPLLKKVPWVVTEAKNTAEEEPSLKPQTETGDIEEKLAALGYK